MLPKESQEIIDKLPLRAKLALSDVADKFLLGKNEVTLMHFVVAMNMNNEYTGQDQDLVTLSKALIVVQDGDQNFTPPNHRNPNLLPAITKEAAKIYLTDWRNKMQANIDQQWSARAYDAYNESDDEDHGAAPIDTSWRYNHQASLEDLSIVGLESPETNGLQAILNESFRHAEIDDRHRRESEKHADIQFEKDMKQAIEASLMDQVDYGAADVAAFTPELSVTGNATDDNAQ